MNKLVNFLKSNPSSKKVIAGVLVVTVVASIGVGVLIGSNKRGEDIKGDVLSMADSVKDSNKQDEINNSVREEVLKIFEDSFGKGNVSIQNSLGKVSVNITAKNIAKDLYSGDGSTEKSMIDGSKTLHNFAKKKGSTETYVLVALDEKSGIPLGMWENGLAY